MIDEILKDLILNVLPEGDWPVDIIDMQRAKTAIYEIGLECIGADEDIDPLKTEVSVSLEAFAHNELRASQRKAWAKACGVAE